MRIAACCARIDAERPGFAAGDMLDRLDAAVVQSARDEEGIGDSGKRQRGRSPCAGISEGMA